MTELLVKTGGYLSQVFRPVDTYASEIELSHELDAECFICRDTYSTYTGSGCRALRLKHCNHLIGEACFAEWIRHQPEICPYWNHHLPKESISACPALRDESLLVKLARVVASTIWFQLCDLLLDRCVIEDPIKIRWMQNMASSRLSRRRATDIWWFYFVNSFTTMFMGYGVLATLLVTPLVLLLKLGSSFLGLAGTFWAQPVLGWTLKMVWVASFLNSAVFMFVAERVIGISVMRSERARMTT